MWPLSAPGIMLLWIYVLFLCGLILNMFSMTYYMMLFLMFISPVQNTWPSPSHFLNVCVWSSHRCLAFLSFQTKLNLSPAKLAHPFVFPVNEVGVHQLPRQNTDGSSKPCFNQIQRVTESFRFHIFNPSILTNAVFFLLTLITS